MKINSYNCGVMRIEGTEYADDVTVFADSVKPNWWRRAGHRLDEEDLYDVFDYEPDVLVVGQGASGMLEIPVLTRQAIQERGITLIADDTEHAWMEFNKETQKGRKVAGVFHLTC